MVSDRGGKYGFVYKSQQSKYKALRRQGKSKRVAAMIANASRTKKRRKAMARKGVRTKRARYGKSMRRKGK